jgi:hypothetical protein
LQLIFMFNNGTVPREVAMKEYGHRCDAVSGVDCPPSDPAPPPTPASNDNDVSLLRDTIAVHIGQVGELLLQQTFASPATVSRYFAWLERLERPRAGGDESQYELASAGVGPHGSLKLVARPRVDEFLGYLEHPDFIAIVSLAFSATQRELIGLHVVGFDGKPIHATRWLQVLKRALSGRKPKPKWAHEERADKPRTRDQCDG